MDLLSKMLVLNPSDRIPVEKALSHRLLNNYHDADDEPICLPSFNFDFEKEVSDMQRAFHKELYSNFYRSKGLDFVYYVPYILQFYAYFL